MTPLSFQNKQSIDELLSRENVDQKKLLQYATKVARYVTDDKLSYEPVMIGQNFDLALFRYSTLYKSHASVRIEEKHGHRLVIGLLGDALLEVRTAYATYNTLPSSACFAQSQG